MPIVAATRGGRAIDDGRERPGLGERGRPVPDGPQPDAIRVGQKSLR